MSLHQRVSANTGRRASISHASVPPFGSSRPDDRSSSARLTHTTPTAVPSDYEQRLLDSLNTAHTELNKTIPERDRYLNLLEQANKKLSDVNLANTDLKAQNQTHKDSIASLQEKLQKMKEENATLNYENDLLERDYAELKTKYATLAHQYSVLSSTSPVGSSGSLPERTKLSRSSSKKERKEDREDRSRNRDKEKHRDRDKDEKRDRDRERDKEKEKEKDREKKEQKAEKERLSRRFEEKRGAPPPSSANRRNSFIEGWGPGGRSSSSGSSNRSFTNPPNGHAQVPAVTTTHKVAYSTVPRTPVNPMTPRIYSSPGSTAAVFDDDGSYEDGNYHAYPIVR